MRNRVLKPEKIVERDVLLWAASHNWFLSVVNSGKKRVEKKMIHTRAAPIGMTDLVGCDGRGHAVFIELKAPGKESACRLSQRLFLERAIECNAFACVVSDINVLADIYEQWQEIISENAPVGMPIARQFLKSKLPASTLVGGRRMKVS
jgi:hypothetical protein